MPIEENPIINLLVCVAPILVLCGAAALIGTFRRVWYLKKWRALDRKTQGRLLDRDLNVALSGWVILILCFAAMIFQPGRLPGAPLLFIGAGLALIGGFMIFRSLSLHFRARSTPEK